MRCFILLVVLALPVSALAATPASDPSASKHAGTAAAKSDGAEIYLYPGSEADISAYGRCAHVKNTTSDTFTAFAIRRETWPQMTSLTAEQGVIVTEITPCKP
jgi:hypothetical protein